MDGHEAIKIGDLEATFVSLSIVEPEFNKEDFPQARLRGTVELTPRKGEGGKLRTFIDTTNVGDSGRGPQLVDEDRHAICQAIFKCKEGGGVGATSLLQGGQHSEAGQQFEGNGFVDAEGRKDNWRSAPRLES